MLKLSDVAAQNARAAERAAGSGAASGDAPATAPADPAAAPPNAVGSPATITTPALSIATMPPTPAPSSRARGDRATLPQKLLLALQPIPLLLVFDFLLRSPNPAFRQLVVVAIAVSGGVFALAIWSHFFARPFRQPERRPTQRPPHFSPPLVLGTLTLFLATLHATLYYSGHPTPDTILLANASWAPISIPLETTVILAYAVLLIALGVTVPKRRTLL